VRIKTVSVVSSILLLLALTLGAAQAQDQTIVDLAVATPELSTLVTAVQAAGLVDVLADPDAEWTVFAPTNDAFDALPEGALEALLADTELLTRVLTYHVVEGSVTSDMLSDMMAPSMEMTAPGADLMGSELEVTVNDDGSVIINDANVIQADIIASNGVVHIIDAVLIPPDIADMMSEMMAEGDMDAMMGMGALYASTNPADLANDTIIGLSDDMMDMGATFGNFTDIASVQSIWFDGGSAYTTVDVTAEDGAIYVYDGLAYADSMDIAAPARMIGGTTAAGLVAPKGIQVIEELDLILVANNGPANVKGFALDADGDVEPMIVIANFGDFGGSVWDIFYSADTDQLFVAGTTGAVFVYNDFSTDMGATLSSTIIPSDDSGAQISVNLHGLWYDAASDTLLLSDVGAADNNTDGQLFAITEASTATGNVPVAAQIGGDTTMLGNPVDIAFDGANLIVAEKANDAVLSYNDFLGLSGSLNQAADVVLELTKPESLAYADSMMMEQ
jgi:uncharacterized surface protein with fasciclin (FAS1) repeats